jgi:hypothetical protein
MKILGQGIWNEQVEIPNDFHETCDCSTIFMNNVYTEFHENTTYNVVADIKAQTDGRSLTNVEVVPGLGISSVSPL